AAIAVAGHRSADRARPTTTSQPSRRLARERVWAVIRYGPQEVRRARLGHDGSARGPTRGAEAAHGPMVPGPRLVLSGQRERQTADTSGAVMHRFVHEADGRRPPPGRATVVGCSDQSGSDTPGHRALVFLRG